MKKNLTKMLAVAALGLLLLPACKKSGDDVTSNGGKAGSLTASVSSLPLNKAMLNDTTSVVSFSFTTPNYGYKAAITNTLQIDVASDNFKNPTSATLGTNVHSQGYSTATFNNLVLKLNVPAGVATPIQVRIMSSISANVAPIYSNVLSLSVTAFNLASWIYVVGAFQGWNASSPDSLLSATGNGVYTGIIDFTAGNNQFLILPVKGTYNTKYATTEGAATGTSATYSTELVSSGGNNFYAPTAAGYYLITLNINTNTISITPSDYYSLTGSAALGWGNDTPMKFINDGSNNWVATTVPMTAAEYKFRLDDAWNVSWGPGAAANSAVTSGATGDGNFQIATAGNYNFTFTQPATAFGGTSLGTTTYTAVKQ